MARRAQLLAQQLTWRRLVLIPERCSTLHLFPVRSAGLCSAPSCGRPPPTFGRTDAQIYLGATAGRRQRRLSCRRAVGTRLLCPQCVTKPAGTAHSPYWLAMGCRCTRCSPCCPGAPTCERRRSQLCAPARLVEARIVPAAPSTPPQLTPPHLLLRLRSRCSAAALLPCRLAATRCRPLGAAAAAAVGRRAARSTGAAEPAGVQCPAAARYGAARRAAWPGTCPPRCRTCISIREPVGQGISSNSLMAGELRCAGGHPSSSGSVVGASGRSEHASLLGAM